MFQYVTPEAVLTASGRKPERKQFSTPEILKNIEELCLRVNRLLNLLGVEEKILDLSDGLRAPGPGGHPKGMALDIIELKVNKQRLGKLIASRPDLLKECGLMIEDLGSTQGQWTDWVHLDYMPRPVRPSYSFKP